MIWTRFWSNSDIPIAEISGASRNDPRSGRYAIRSTTNPHTEVSTSASSNTSIRINTRSAIEDAPTADSIRMNMREMKAPTMKTSPCAKLIMPMIP